MECVLPYGKTLREATLYVLNIKGETPLVVSNPPVLGNFTRATVYETIHAVKLNECGVRNTYEADGQPGSFRGMIGCSAYCWHLLDSESSRSADCG